MYTVHGPSGEMSAVTLSELVAKLLTNGERVSVQENGSDAVRERYCAFADGASNVLAGVVLAIRNELALCDHPQDHAAVSLRQIALAVDTSALALMGLDRLVRLGVRGPTPNVAPKRCKCQPWDGACSCY